MPAQIVKRRTVGQRVRASASFGRSNQSCHRERRPRSTRDNAGIRLAEGTIQLAEGTVSFKEIRKTEREKNVRRGFPVLKISRVWHGCPARGFARGHESRARCACHFGMGQIRLGLNGRLCT